LFRGLLALALGLVEPVLLAIPLWVLLYRFFKHYAQPFYLLPAAALALFSTQAMRLWHAGLIVPTLIAIFWIARFHHSNASEPQWEATTRKAFLVYVIAIQIAWTGYAVALGFVQPYSPDLATARYLAPRVQAGDKIAVTYLTQSDIKAFFFVGLEPYFQRNIFMNAEEPFWLFSTKNRTEDLFYEALRQHPPIVLAVLNKYPYGDPLIPARDIVGSKVDLLHRNGYVLTHIFCGEQPSRLDKGVQACHLIFEPKSE
jgi:hypothetical protein